MFEFPYTPSNTSAATQAGLSVSRGKLPKQQPSTVQEWEHFIKLSPEDQTRYLHMKRQGYVIKDVGGVPTMAPQIPGLPSVPLSSLQKEAAAAGTIKGAEKAATESAEYQSFLQKNRSKAQASLGNVQQRAQRLAETVDKAIPMVGHSTAGAGSVLSAVPLTQARDLRALIDTVKANVGFDELNLMRQFSPTGGALGNVTERELAFLQSVIANLEQSQSPDQLKLNLTKTKEEVQKSWGRIQAAYEQDYGKASPGPTKPRVGERKGGYIFRGGDPADSKSWVKQ